MPNQATEEDQLRMFAYFNSSQQLHQWTVARLYLLNTLVAQESLFPL
jgi:hypothetical protein